MIRNLDYKITQEADSILSFLKEHGYSSNLIVHLKKTPESILKNGIWSYVNEPLHAGDLFHIHIEENEGSDHIMHPEVRELLEKLLYMLADEGEDATFDYIRREVLHKRSKKDK